MVVSEPTVALEVVESSQPGEVRRLATQMAVRLGFDGNEQGQVAIVATELATNLVRHAKGGEILIQAPENHSTVTLEIMAVDHGPGIENVDRSLEDGFSTGGTSGAGLGAVKRLSAYFDIHTTLGSGSVAVARFQHKAVGLPPHGRFEIGSVSRCYPGETVCGDAWASHELEGILTILVADGLGHGPLAAEAAQAALQIFEAHTQESPAEILQLAQGALRSTRGAAIAIARIDSSKSELTYAGMGNIAALLIEGGKSKNLVSINGTVGAGVRKIHSFTYPWSAAATLVMFSDGLASNTRVDRHPGLLARDPTLVAGVLYRDFKRGRDDATVVVAREREEVAR